MKDIVSSTYMSSKGVRLRIKGRVLFYWVVVHTEYFTEDITIEYSTVVITSEASF